MKEMLQKTHEILFKPYSQDVIGYIARIINCGNYIVVNSNLPKEESEKAQAKLLELETSFPQDRFILLQGNGQIYKSENLQLAEMGETA